MQRLCRNGDCKQLLQNWDSAHVVIRLISARRLTTRGSPDLGSTRPPPNGSRKYPKTPSGSEAGRSHNKGHRNAEGPLAEEAKTTKASRKLPISLGKIITFSTLAYVGYRLYTWQTDPHRSHILNPRFFVPFILEARQQVSSTSSILSLLSVPKGQNIDYVTEAWKTGVWSVQVMQPELQIARSYTPLPPTDDAAPEQLRLFVRKEPQGEVSSFLHRISRGTLVHLRGPRVEYAIPEDVDEVLFLAGGTGIAPALQVAHILYNYRQVTASNTGPKLRILWANRRREDSCASPEQISQEQPPAELGSRLQGSAGEASTLTSRSQNVLVREVESLKAKYAGKVSVEYFVDDDSSYITENLLENYLQNIDQVSQHSPRDSPTRKKLLLISGPEGFIEFYAGPKSMKGGYEIQGPLGGILHSINHQGWEVWKL